MEGTSALVVGDDAEMRVALSRQLDSVGYAAVTAANGQEALDIIQNCAYIWHCNPKTTNSQYQKLSIVQMCLHHSRKTVQVSTG